MSSQASFFLTQVPPSLATPRPTLPEKWPLMASWAVTTPRKAAEPGPVAWLLRSCSFQGWAHALPCGVGMTSPVSPLTQDWEGQDRAGRALKTF